VRGLGQPGECADEKTVVVSEMEVDQHQCEFALPTLLALLLQALLE
jgi:hypothetical protein